MALGSGKGGGGLTRVVRHQRKHHKPSGTASSTVPSRKGHKTRQVRITPKQRKKAGREAAQIHRHRARAEAGLMPRQAVKTTTTANRPTKAKVVPAVVSVRRQQRQFQKQYKSKPATTKSFVADTKLAFTGTKHPDTLDYAIGGALALAGGAGRLGSLARLARTARVAEEGAGGLSRLSAGEKIVKEGETAVKDTSKVAKKAEPKAVPKPEAKPKVKAPEREPVKKPPEKPAPKERPNPKSLRKDKPVPKKEPVLRKVRRYREERVPLKERPGAVGKVVRQRRKIGAAAAVAPVAVNPSQGIHGKGPGFAAVEAAGKAAQSVLPGPVGNAARDVIEFPAQTIPTAYALGHAGVKAAEGDSSEAKALWESYKKNGFLPKVASGDLSGAAKTFEKHPVFSGLEVAGLYGGVGRAAGAAARHSGVAALRDAASTERAPAKLAEGIEIKREYSPNPATKAGQRALERRRVKRNKPVVSETKANRYIKKRLNYHAGKGHAKGRDIRDKVVKAMTDQHPKRGPMLDRKAGDVVSFVAQRAIRRPETWREDINKLIKTYQDARKSGELTKPEIAANKHNVEVLRAAEDLPEREVRKVFQSAEHYVGQEQTIRPLMVEQGHYDPAQTERASLFPYARLHMGAKYGVSKETKAEIAAMEEKIASLPKDARPSLRRKLDVLRKREELIDSNGNRLPTEAIKAHMAEATGSTEAGFLTHRPQSRNPFYVAPAERTQVPRGVRTGEAFMRGTFDASYQALAEHLLRSHSIVSAVNIFDQIGAQFGARKIGAKAPMYFKSPDEVRLAVGDPERFKLSLVPGERYVPFQITPRFPKAAEIKAIHDLTPEEEVVLTNLESRLSGTGNGHYVAVPQAVASLLRQHYRVPTKFEKGMQVGTGQFKSTVLPTSPSFFTGNLLDNYIVRTTVSNVTPLDYALGRRVLSKLEAHDSALANDVRLQFLRGTLYGSAKTERVFRSASKDFDSRAANIVAGLLRSPGVRQIRRAWNAYRNGVLSLNARMEAQPQIAGFGKLARQEMRQAHESWASVLGLQEKVVLDFAKRLKDPDNEIKFAQAMWDMWGKWDDWSPSTRYFLQTYSPFGSWLYNASRLAIWTLPVKHPIKAGIIAAMENASSGEREAQGRSLFAKKPMPGYLQGGIPWGPGGKGVLGLSHFSSFGIFDDPAQTVSGAVLPQFSSGLKALIGIKWTGQQLVDAKNHPLTLEQRFLVAANATVEGFVPLASWIRRLREGGPSADDSTIFNPKVKKLPKKYQKDYKGGLSLLNPFTYYDPKYVKYLRAPKTVETYPSSSSGGSSTGSSFSSGSGFSSSFSGGSAFK